MKKITLVTLIVFGFFASHAQVVYDYLKAADTYYTKGDYFSAAKYYEKYLGLNATKAKGNEYDPYTIASMSKQQKIAVSNRQQAIYKLAESYRLLNYHVKAEPYYAQATAFSTTEFPLVNYWYGKTLRALAKYDVADSAFNHFVASYTSNDTYKEDANREIKNLDFIQEQLKKDIKLYTVGKSASMLNTNGASYAPVWINKNALAFTSTRPDSSAGKNTVYTNRIYLASYSDGVVNSVQKTDLPQAANVHQGVVSFTPDGNTIFLTRWTIADGKKSASIYSSKKTGSTWAEPKLLDSSINITGSSTQQPFVMPDGKRLLFASDRAGGLGGFDIWSVDLDAAGNVTGIPVNLGAPVNSKYDEQAPYYHSASNSLVFSSNGNVGMGGYDFFQSKGSFGAWGTPENLGYPLNSIKDDIYFVSNGKAKNILGDVMFSSDRSSECCLEMFTLSKIRPLKQISGKVVTCDGSNPLSGAKVEVINASNKVVASKVTDSDGSYAFTMEDFEDLKATANADGYIEASATSAAITDDNLVQQTVPTFCLVKPVPPPPPPPPVDTVVVMNNIYFDFNKASILPESYQYIDAQILEMLNKYPTMVIEIGGHTDDVGNDAYNLKLSEARANAVKAYLVTKGIAAERMEAKGYGETKPVEPNRINGKDNPEGRKKNRRTEFKVLHY